MNDHHKALFIAAALIGFGVCSAQAAHKDVKHCADDYRKFCHAWGSRPRAWKTVCASTATN